MCDTTLISSIDFLVVKYICQIFNCLCNIIILRQINKNLSLFAIECLELSSWYRNDKEIVKLSGIACGFGILLLIGAVTTYIVLRKHRNRQIDLGIIVEFHYLLSNNNYKNKFLNYICLYRKCWRKIEYKL